SRGCGYRHSYSPEAVRPRCGTLVGIAGQACDAAVFVAATIIRVYRGHMSMREAPSPVVPPRSPLSGSTASWPEPGVANARRLFWGLFAVVFAIKLLVAARLPLFVDEAFYWLEGQHLAPAYSDLPGLTAWLARL